MSRRRVTECSSSRDVRVCQAEGCFDDETFSRQARVPGFRPEALKKARIAIVGAGGIGSEVGRALARRGVGRLVLFDFDRVAPSNLTRQLFYPQDLNQPKAFALARNLAHESTAPDFAAVGVNLAFDEAFKTGTQPDCDLYIVGVDRNVARVDAARIGLAIGKPMIHIGLGRDASSLYVFVQTSRSTDPCWGDVFLDVVRQVIDGRDNAPGCAPALIDCAQVASGLAMYAVDSVLMQRPRAWNYRRISLNSFEEPEPGVLAKLHPRCPLHEERRRQNKEGRVAL